MEKLKLFVLLSLAAVSSAPVFAQSFPMLGQTWVFVNGPNEETHVVGSISDFAPSSAILVRFRENGTVDFRYSNLSGRFIKSTAEALDSITYDFHRHVLLGSTLFQASRQPVPDTAYSCDAELAKLAHTLRYTRYVINGQAVTPTTDDRAWQWFYTVPECYASRPATAQDKQEKNLCQNHWCSDPTDNESSPYHEVCDDAYTECRQGVEEAALQTKPSTRYFWNLHLFPSIVLHPRHPATGRIMKEISMTEDEALAKRQDAIANPGNEDLKPYLNPVMDDSASVYFSGQFLWEDGGPYGVWSTNLEVAPDGEGTTGFYHFPPRAYRVTSFSDWLGLSKALLLPFARDEAEKDFLTNLDTRCPGWRVPDRRIGQKAFHVQGNLDVTLPDVLPAAPTDPAWTYIHQEQVAVDGGTEVRTVVSDNRVLSGQTALVRNSDFPYGDYFWKGCPDIEDDFFHSTKVQLGRILAWPVPTCNVQTLVKAPNLYRQMETRFTGAEDASERALAEQRAQEAEFQYARTIGKERPAALTCSDTPLDILLRRTQP